MTYAFDTNTIIHLLNYNESVRTNKEEAVAKEARFIIPPVVDYEMRRGLSYKPSPKKEKMYWSLTNYYGVGQRLQISMWSCAENTSLWVMRIFLLLPFAL